VEDRRHVVELVTGSVHILVLVLFVVSGMLVDIRTAVDLPLLGTAAGLCCCSPGQACPCLGVGKGLYR
jgi:hypothetical protein